MTYTTIQGDTWDGIAYKVYSKEAILSQLIAANQQYADTVIFSAGVQLIMPTVAAETSTALPPWKRGGGT
jgi:phage tail protein X